ncbi:MAG: hypothetical protein P4K93_06285 [Terracidiphilus sp.]|nr:hypothetical protein [Terracidiphilus sp.]
MNVHQKTAIFPRRGLLFALPLCLALSAVAPAQKPTAPPTALAPSAAPSGCTLPAGPSHADAKAPSKITPEQAQKLFALVDVLIKFSSDETGLPIKSSVKRQLTSRDEVEKYLEEKFNEDQGTKRLQRDEIVLKKFGLLDRDFELKPFLLALLKEQIEAYYDSKTKTVNMLDWVGPDDEQPVLAHELTHALQDQHSNLEKWNDQTPDDVSTDSAGDNDHLAKDEMDTARDAVAEGQATVVMWDCELKPMGKSLIKDPEVLDLVKNQMSGAEDSPVMARAPLLLSESMLFPYREGMSFEQDVWMDQGQMAAFAGALDRPPTSSWEIINPREYEKRHIPAIPLLPNIHPLTDPTYKPYDIGQVGQLDVHILSELLGSDNAARDLTPAWNGGLYWAGQLRSATTPAAQADTASIGLFYLSIWKNADSAQVFARIYSNTLGRKYSHVGELSSGTSAASDGSVEHLFTTNEGPVLITTRGKMVFIAESFPLPLARQLTALIFDAQGGGPMHMANAPLDLHTPPLSPDAPRGALTSDLVHFFAEAGVMKSVVDAERLALQKSLAP